jgi:hypothetical protein
LPEAVEAEEAEDGEEARRRRRRRCCALACSRRDTAPAAERRREERQEPCMAPSRRGRWRAAAPEAEAEPPVARGGFASSTAAVASVFLVRERGVRA